MSWDVRLDGRRRRDLRLTVIFDASLGAIVWAHYAPAITDGLRASYRRLLRWNDEFPFVKFALAEDGRPTLAAEIPIERLGCDELGLAFARVLAVSDTLFDETAGWLGPAPRGRPAGVPAGEAPADASRVASGDGLGGAPDVPATPPDPGPALLARYAARLGGMTGD